MLHKLSYGLIFFFALFLALLARLQTGHESYPMASWFLWGWIVFIVLAGTLSVWHPSKMKLSALGVAVALLPVLGSEPLFENDQYRYLWEGKVLSEGLNPWQIPPAEETLDHIDFPQRELVGYNKLTSPYSPLAVVYHAAFSGLSYQHALMGLQLINIGLSAFVIGLLPPLAPIFTIGLTGLVAKEFAQSVHIDLVAWMFFFFALKLFERGQSGRAALCFAVSGLIKVNILLAFAWFFSSAWRSSRWRGAILWGLTLVVCLGANLWGPLSLHQNSGLMAFMEHWVWHSLILALWQFVGFTPLEGIKLANMLWLSGIIAGSLFCLRRAMAGWSWSTFLFAHTAFWRPAFNPWYAPWFALTGAHAGERWIMIYGLLSPLAYTKYAAPSDELMLGVICLTHLPFILYLVSYLKKSRFTREKYVNI